VKNHLALSHKPKYNILLLGIIAAVLALAGIYIVFKSHAAASDADINGDGVVDVRDLAILAANFRKTGQNFASGDLNGDGMVDIQDFSLLALNWGLTGGGTGGGGDTGYQGLGFPDASTTGYTHAPGYTGSLSTAGSCVFNGSASNVTYSHCSFSQSMTLASGVTNVSFVGCDFHIGTSTFSPSQVTLSGASGGGPTGVTFSYDTFEPAYLNGSPRTPGAITQTDGVTYQYAIDAQGHSIEIDHADIWGYGNGVQIYNSGASTPSTMTDSYMHDAAISDPNNQVPPADVGPYHVDSWGNEFSPGSANYWTLNHTTIVMPAHGNTNIIALQGGNFDHITMTNNYLSGDNNMLNIRGASTNCGVPSGSITNMTFTGNTWGTDNQQDGVSVTVCDKAWFTQSFGVAGAPVWRNNKIHYVNPIRVDGQNSSSYQFVPGDDGAFWLPGVSGDTRASWMSSTDYSS